MRKFWKLKVPPKVKLFIWRVCKGRIPTRTVVIKMKIITDNRCPICSGLAETVHHALWGCKWSRKVWKEAGFGGILTPHGEGDAFDNILRAADSLEVSNFEFYITIIWELWNHRNNVV